MKKRLIQIADLYNFSIRLFELECGLKRGNISNMSENGGIGSDKLAKIIDRFPDISTEWLITGKEPMLKEQSATQQSTIADNNTIIYKELLEKKEIEIKELCREVGALSNQNTNLDKNLAALRLELECCKKENEELQRDNAELRSNVNPQFDSSKNMYEIPAQLVAESADKRRRNVLK